MKCQQFELYAAEGAVNHGRLFASVEDIQRYVDNLREEWWWPVWYPNVKRIEVYARPRNRRESVGAYERDKQVGVIEMLPVHWNELVVLHEISHVLAAARFESRAHDPWFARIYLEMVALVMGPDTYKQLYDAFEAGGIQHVIDEAQPLLYRARPMPPAREPDLDTPPGVWG